MSDGLRSRLEALNRGPLPAAVRATPQRAKHGAAVTVAASSSEPSTAWRAGVVRPIPGLVRRGDVVATECGEHLRVCLPLDELWPGGAALVARRCEALSKSSPSTGDAGTQPDWWDALPETAFLDLETCGLTGSALFLAGLLRPIDGELAVELLLARDYSEESAVLASLWQRLAGVGRIVTFNGKSFDWPMVVDRSRRHLLARGAVTSPPHVDLLHLARRRWRGQFRDCKLQTLERHVCGRLRTDDLPSSQIPAAYQQYVRTRFEREMDAVLMHNALDLVTMLDLAMRLAGE
jgi:uncharacterized protein YprB with RNaseH-like and TPR domain